MRLVNDPPKVLATHYPHRELVALHHVIALADLVATGLVGALGADLASAWACVERHRRRPRFRHRNGFRGQGFGAWQRTEGPSASEA